MSYDIGARLDLAKSLARKAGALAVEMRKNQDAAFSKEKSHQDFVTLADLAVESLIRREIAQAFPADSILGEEEGTTGGGEALWVIDPIDGTTNYMRGLADWGVSIAFCMRERIELGVIYAPDIDTLLWAHVGEGAFVTHQGEEAIARVSDRSTLDNTLVQLGRSARCKDYDYPALLNRVLDRGLEYRRNGSAAFSLLAVALGRAEGFFESHLNPWDAMAGILIVEEAGGTVDYPNFTGFIQKGGAVCASNTKLHDHIRAVIYSKPEMPV